MQIQLKPLDWRYKLSRLGKEIPIHSYYQNSRSLLLRGFLLLLVLSASSSNVETVASKQDWGKLPSGQSVELFTLRDGSVTVQLSNFGARTVAIRVPDRSGQTGDIVLGFASVDGYLDPRNAVMGDTVGRFANRIAHGRFTLDGTEYNIPLNNNGNAFHGGTEGFNKKVWNARIIKNGVEMSLISPDGDIGFPGKLSVQVTFTLIRYKCNPALSLTYLASTDRATVVNLTNHAYFNLSSPGQDPVFEDMHGSTPVVTRHSIRAAFQPARSKPYTTLCSTSPLLIQSLTGLPIAATTRTSF